MTRRNSQQFAKNPVLAFITTLGLMVSQAIPVLAASFNKTGSMNASRQYHIATLLANGAVLVTGGDNSKGALAAANRSACLQTVRMA